MKTGKYNKKGSPKGDKNSDGNTKSGATKSGFKPKKKEMKFTPLDFKSQYAQSSYTTVKNALIAEVTWTFDS